MNPERWQRLKEVFGAALEREPGERAEFLDACCRDDPALRVEVEELLASHSRENILDRPASAAEPDPREEEGAEGLAGTQLGPYEISAEIGRGGMGVVYLAHDTRLDRPVALKMLSPRLARDARLRERLRREARAAARLTHPGIATVYSLEEFGDRICIVSEYVQGPTLQQYLSGRKLPFDQVLDIALQIARSLAAAHAEGIVHRDLKPENIIRTDSGTVKILDFGLARVESRNGVSSGPRLTQSGMFLGTPAYASPEQLLGSAVDRNTDIFSLGIVLYEMASGKHPFQDGDSVSLISHILEADVPELAQADPSIPDAFSGIVRRCLKKKPAERFADTRDLVFEMEKLSRRRSEMPAPAAVQPFWWWQFHQAFAAFGYYGMLYPLWRVKKYLGGVEGSLIFFPALIAVGIAANLRLHLWFTSRYYISELPEQRRKVGGWIRFADCLFVLILAVSAVRFHEDHAIHATLLMAVAIGALVAFSLIEPVTARAALDPPGKRQPGTNSTA